MTHEFWIGVGAGAFGVLFASALVVGLAFATATSFADRSLASSGDLPLFGGQS